MTLYNSIGSLSLRERAGVRGYNSSHAKSMQANKKRPASFKEAGLSII
jgi:hypothetical protein